jgi:hypothetical protein
MIKQFKAWTEYITFSFVAALGIELRVYTLSHPTSPFL